MSSPDPSGSPPTDKPTRDGRSLFHRAATAAAWISALQVITRTLSLVRNVVLARLLAPDDFGLFGITLAVLSAAENLSGTGLQAALIQRKDDVSDFLDTAWTILVLRGIALALAALAGAPVIAWFYNEPRVQALVSMLAIVFVARGASNVGVLLLERELDPRARVRIQLATTLSELLTAIVGALILRSAWALVLSLVCATIVQLIGSYVAHPYRPRMAIDWVRARALSRFSRFVYFSHVLWFLSIRGDNFIIGWALGLEALGVYVLAVSVSEALSLEISRVLNAAAFPAYARAQDDPDQLRRGYLGSIELVAAASLPVAAVATVAGHEVVSTVFGPGWEPMGGLLGALTFAGALRALTSVAGTVFRGIGRPELTLAIQVLLTSAQLGTMLSLLALGLGLDGVVIGTVVGNLVAAPLQLALIRRTLGVTLRQQGAALLPGVLLALPCMLPAVAATHLGLAGQGHLAASVLGASLTYVLVAFIQLRVANAGPLKLVTFLLASRRRV
jgi:lipopolysaccharide exporter